MSNINRFTQKELAELAIMLKDNVDDADQVQCYFEEIISHCDKAFLAEFIHNMASSIRSNRNLGITRNEIYRPEEIGQRPHA